MNPYLMAIYSVLRRTRTCPKCGKEQVVPHSKIRGAVRCKFCDAEIPPPK